MLIDRFWNRVATATDAECWPWTGTRHQAGYGLFYGRTEKRWLRAHRVSWEIANGQIPEGMNVCHRCDNPPCVNPAHLFLGSQADNVADMYSKGRDVHNVPTGDAHWMRRPFVGMTPTERFWSHVDRPDLAGCWIWPRVDKADGYGRYWDPDAETITLAHRHAWEATNGPPTGFISHVCGNRACVNPDHMFIGTLAEFFRAYPERKPAYSRRVGAENPAAKLDPEKVRSIRRRHAAGEPTATIAADYGVTTMSVRNIVRRKTWNHVS